MSKAYELCDNIIIQILLFNYQLNCSAEHIIHDIGEQANVGDCNRLPATGVYHLYMYCRHQSGSGVTSACWFLRMAIWKISGVAWAQ